MKEKHWLMTLDSTFFLAYLYFDRLLVLVATELLMDYSWDSWAWCCSSGVCLSISSEMSVFCMEGKWLRE